MKSVSMKKILAVLVIALLLVSVSSFTFAKSSTIFNPDDITASDSDAAGVIQDISGTILGIVQVVGVAVAVIMLVVLAIKYISAAPSEKADIKKSAFIYIIGALLLFGGVALLNIIQNAGADLEDATAMVVYEQRV